MTLSRVTALSRTCLISDILDVQYWDTQHCLFFLLLNRKDLAELELKAAVSDVFFIKVIVKQQNIPTAITDSVCSVTWVSPSLYSAVNRKYIFWSGYKFCPIRRENNTKKEFLHVHVVMWEGGKGLLTVKTNRKLAKSQNCLQLL